MLELLQKFFYENALLNWIEGIALVFLSILIARVFYLLTNSYVLKFYNLDKLEFKANLLKSLSKPISFAIALIGIRFSLNFLEFPESFEIWLQRGFHLLFVLSVAWGGAKFLDAIFLQFLIPLTKSSESDLDDMVVPFLQKSSKALIWIIAILIGLSNAGYNVGALLAGLGIGGVAIALAARTTITNIIGGITIFIDQPFKIGDKIRVKSRVRGLEGKVLDVGLRQTRVVTEDGTVLHIPNSIFSNDAVENVSMEESKKVTNFFKLHKKNEPQKIQLAMSLLHKTAKEDPDILEKVIVSFVSIEDNFLGILYIYFVKKTQDDNEVQTRVNIKILEEFASHGILWAENLQPNSSKINND